MRFLLFLVKTWRRRSLTVDQTLAYGTFLHTILFTAPRLGGSSVPGLCGLIAAALIVYSIAVPLRSGAQGYSLWCDFNRRILIPIEES